MGKTSIFIAHRLATVVDCDWILVLEGGRVVESGTHEQLLQQEGSRYAQLWAIQANTQAAEEAAPAEPAQTTLEAAQEKPRVLRSGPSSPKAQLAAAEEVKEAEEVDAEKRIMPPELPPPKV